MLRLSRLRLDFSRAAFRQAAEALDTSQPRVRHPRFPGIPDLIGISPILLRVGWARYRDSHSRSGLLADALWVSPLHREQHHRPA